MTIEQVDAIAMPVIRDGEWLPGDELRRSMAAAVSGDEAVEVELDGMEHVDARPLQLLLAFVVERTAAGRAVRLLHVSAGLARWFEFVGAASLMAPLQVERAA